MPTWGQQLDVIKKGILAAAARNEPYNLDLDGMRKNALADLAKYTGRPIVAYVSRWTSGGGRDQDMMVQIGDVHAFMEVLHGLNGPALDVILHTAGGSPTAAEAIVEYVRTKFSDVRIIVPLAAMSAGTLMACAGNRILMGKHSYLGPTDPQLVVHTPLGVQSIPAQAILDQFKLAQSEAGDANKYAAWIPMLQQYGPGLIVHCERVLALSHELAERWLARFMFAAQGAAVAAAAAKAAAKALNDPIDHKVHGRFLSRDKVRAIGLVVDDLEADQQLQDLALTAFHAFAHTFNFNAAAQKIVENSIGRSFVRTTGTAILVPGQAQPGQPQPLPVQPQPPVTPGPPPTEEARKTPPTRGKRKARRRKPKER